MNNKISKKGFTLIELGICLLIISVFAAMAPDPFSPKSSTLARRDCFDNQRIIQSAIEMYNMDVPTMVNTMLPGEDFESFENLLLKMGYFKEPLPLPSEKCSYGFINITKDDGTVFCKYHGTPESKDIKNPIIPKYDKNLEKTFSDNYYKSKEKANKKREHKLLLEELKRPSALIPFIMGTFGILFLIIGLSIYFSNRKKNKKN